MIKKTSMLFMAAMMVAITGCDDLPTVESAKAIAQSCGTAAGYACQLTKLDEKVKTVINDIIDLVYKVSPTEGKTFTDAWTPIIDEKLTHVVSLGKLDPDQKNIVTLVSTAMTTGIDYLFTTHPKWKSHEEIVAASVSGFCEGFKKVVGTSLAVGEVKYDTGCYDAVKAKLAK